VVFDIRRLSSEDPVDLGACIDADLLFVHAGASRAQLCEPGLPNSAVRSAIALLRSSALTVLVLPGGLGRRLRRGGALPAQELLGEHDGDPPEECAQSASAASSALDRWLCRTCRALRVECHTGERGRRR
jgi:hypothetical protein